MDNEDMKFFGMLAAGVALFLVFLIGGVMVAEIFVFKAKVGFLLENGFNEKLARELINTLK